MTAENQQTVEALAETVQSGMRFTPEADPVRHAALRDLVAQAELAAGLLEVWYGFPNPHGPACYCARCESTRSLLARLERVEDSRNGLTSGEGLDGVAAGKDGDA